MMNPVVLLTLLLPFVTARPTTSSNDILIPRQSLSTGGSASGNGNNADDTTILNIEGDHPPYLALNSFTPYSSLGSSSKPTISKMLTNFESAISGMGLDNLFTKKTTVSQADFLITFAPIAGAPAQTNRVIVGAAKALDNFYTSGPFQPFEANFTIRASPSQRYVEGNITVSLQP